MNKNFRYIKKNGNFICRNDKFKIEYSKPVLKGNDFSSVKTLEDIESCSYILKIFKSMDNGKWRLLNSKEIHGEGIFDFQKSIYDMLHLKKIGCQKEIDSNGKINYCYKRNNNASYYDDVYEITKYWTDNEIFFSMYIGFLIDECNSDGIYLINLSYDDILIWKKCIDDFIDYAKMVYNQKIRTYNKFHSKCYKLHDGRIYYFDINNPSRMKNIYTAKEDIFDITEVDFVDKETFVTKYHKDVTIEEVTNKNIILSNGLKIKSGRIQNLERHFDEEDDRFGFGANGVANDFIYALSVNDRDDFNNLSREELLNKYGEVFINRTYVGSSYHPISDDIETFQNKVLDKVIEKIGTKR